MRSDRVLLITHIDTRERDCCCAHHCSCLLCVCAADRINGWTMAEQLAWIARPQGPAQFQDCIGAVDATYVRIQRPKVYADERRLYSFYKKYHAVFFMCVVDRRGIDEHT